MARAAARDDKIDVRLSKSHKRLLQLATIATGARSVSDFMLQSAIARAEEALPDRQVFRLDADAWEAFQAMLDAPPRPLPRMTRLLTEPSVFEQPKVK